MARAGKRYIWEKGPVMGGSQYGDKGTCQRMDGEVGEGRQT